MVPVAILVLAPLMIVVALVVRFGIGSPILYRGRRVGRDDVVFSQLKFRTMTDACDEHGVPLPDAERITRIGRVLRSLSLDELPQLFNVLRGDMSLIGPRPLPVAYLERYSPAQRRRHEVRPGLTGLAQSMGRNSVPWAQRFAWDVMYVEHGDFLLDARIAWRSLRLVLTRGGISAEGHATAPEFLGFEPALAPPSVVETPAPVLAPTSSFAAPVRAVSGVVLEPVS